MPLTNKDGTPYELSKPNPLMLQQELEEGWIRVHNFDKQEEILEYKKKIKPPQTIVDEPIIEPKPLQELETEIPKVEPPKVIEEKRNVMFCYCLPAEIKYINDPLYNESRAVVKYGDKFTFEAIIINRSEMDYTLMTNVLIPSNSIIYVRDDRRWWRAMKTTIQDSGGYWVSCVPSMEKPSFND